MLVVTRTHLVQLQNQRRHVRQNCGRLPGRSFVVMVVVRREPEVALVKRDRLLFRLLLQILNDLLTP